MWDVLTSRARYGPIGVDVGARSVKLVQLTADAGELVAAARWDLPPESEKPGAGPVAVASAIRRAREGGGFRGREAVLSLSHRTLFLQNVRVPKCEGAELERQIHQEAGRRFPFPVAEAEIRFLDVADVRQTGAVLREVILMAAQRSAIEEAITGIEGAGLVPVSIDAEPLALLRGYAAQFRREADHQQRTLYVHLGYSRLAILIGEGEQVFFVKYVEIGGRHLDEAAANGMGMKASDAAGLRRHNGDRRADQQDPEIARSIAQAIRPVLENVIDELSMCVRYHSVTFRGKPLDRMVLGGSEATAALSESLSARLNLKCEVSQPFRRFAKISIPGRPGQWDLALGLALRTREAYA
jgi:type IV pilus assembly protein PilM